MGQLTERGEAILAGTAGLDDTAHTEPATEEAASQTAAEKAESPGDGAPDPAPSPGVPDEPKETATDPAATDRETREA